MTTKDLTKTSGIKPFLYQKEVWDENVERTSIKTGTATVKVDNKMVVLNGSETPGQFMLWLKDYEDKIINNPNTAPVDNLAVLVRITTGAAQLTVSEAITIFTNATTPSSFNIKDLAVNRIGAIRVFEGTRLFFY